MVCFGKLDHKLCSAFDVKSDVYAADFNWSSVLELSHDYNISYKEVSKFVGGMVECVQFPNGDLLLLNEEGKIFNLPLNPEATTLWRATFTKDKYAYGYDDFVVGPAILIKKKALDSWAK